ncbi:hypothetical protein H0H92_003944 [Tricholoma furcatifolium]|nr:hypothetical protein H0H92_003944 [Tricholoma furcatifolium]
MPLTTLTTPSGNCLFSQEIFDNILDHVSPDIPTLSLCSTVCKAWLPRCRYHIFFDVNLTPKLADFLSSSSRIFETITPYIRNAALGGVWSLAERGEYDQVVSLLLTLDNLRGLSIETWSWDFLSLTSSDRILNLKGVGIVYGQVLHA